MFHAKHTLKLSQFMISHAKYLMTLQSFLAGRYSHYLYYCLYVITLLQCRKKVLIKTTQVQDVPSQALIEPVRVNDVPCQVLSKSGQVQDVPYLALRKPTPV